LGTAKFDTCNGYNGINKITSASGLVTYIMASEAEDMATVFSLSSQSINVIINTTLNEWLNN
jgi:hypothetical protein